MKSLEVDAGTVSPWYGQPGLGKQYDLGRSVQELIDDGYLRQVH